MTTYSEKLKDPRWQKKRLEIMQRDKFCCKKCGDAETTLHVHHKEYHAGLRPWDYENKNYITLCEHCHTEVELLKKNGVECIDNVSINKNNNWNNGNRIMWISTPEYVIMKIYGEDGAQICGFIYDSIDDLNDISSLIKKTIKWLKDS